MSDLRDAIRRAADRHEPPRDWFERIHERARRRRRNQRVLASVVGLGLSIVLLSALVWQLRTPVRTKPENRWNVPTRCGSGTKASPTGWWRADGSPADAVGNNDPVLRGGAGFAPGIVGGAFALDGKSAYVEVPDDPALNVGSKDFTVAFWVRFTSTPGNGQVLIEDWVETFDPATSKGWTLINQTPSSIALAMGGGAGGVSAHGLHLPVDTWIHVVARRRGRSLSIFVNGELAATASGNPRLSLDSNASLKFGHRGDARDTPGSLDHRGFFLRGELDEIELFVGRGLSDGAIRHIFETQSACAK